MASEKTLKDIVAALRAAVYPKGDTPEDAEPAEVMSAVEDHFSVVGEDMGIQFLKRFADAPDAWANTLKDLLRASRAHENERIVRAAAQHPNAAETRTSRPAADYAVNAETAQGVVQTESISTLDQKYINSEHLVYVEKGATYVSKDDAVPKTEVDRESALGRYLNHVISHNRYLQLQGIRSGGRLVHIELDRIYITLQTTRKRETCEEDAFLRDRCELAPGENRRDRDRSGGFQESVIVSVNQALADHERFVVLGDPGSGKTTLLRYLALLYARDIAEGTSAVYDKLKLDESGRLPILIPFRNIGVFLSQKQDDGLDGHALLLDFFFGYLKNQRIDLPENFFDEYLTFGNATILLDGLDEVADPDLRRRVSRLVETTP